MVVAIEKEQFASCIKQYERLIIAICLSFTKNYLYLENIKKGEDYKELEKVITINILDFEFLDTTGYQSSFHLWEDIDKDYMLTDLIEIHFLELPKFIKKESKNFKDNPIERWLAFLEEDTSETMLKELMSMEPAIKKAEDKLEYLSSDKETMNIYWERERSLHERANMISSAEERGFNKAMIEVAKSLLDVLDNETIASKTGLSLEDIIKLRNKK